jgi:glycosyltransferase involved in cell wall biosynthesis
VGGTTEFAGGGYAGENAYFSRLGAPDPIVERQLVRAALLFDDIVTMGTGAASFFRQRRPDVRVHVIGGAIDPARFHPGQGSPDFDVIFVGRIVPIKRVDRLIGALALAAADLPSIRAAIIGDGPLRSEMEALAGRLGIADRVTFTGRQDDVASWLRRARVFMLTSASEGVALSLMEATMCGLPAIVPAVGDLGDVVRNGSNGIVVPDATEARLATALVDLLTGKDECWHFRQAAIARSVSYRPEQVTALWAPVLRAQSGAMISPITPRAASARM